MEDLKKSSDVLLIMFSGNLFQSVIALGKKDSFLYAVLQDGIGDRSIVRRSVSPKVHLSEGPLARTF
jgi:hypothetical protein